ncbi:hypothetical protein F8M41_015999 [Gigaspora margarita]|uniref:Uncharacterized protein n=1 Tax=Gigaspora margarita TaxID=4874 RepID=A0A8H4EUH7_GIGMA|nr:hypothetical protein F8M41_015999 [Gigaspora margarita]
MSNEHEYKNHPEYEDPLDPSELYFQWSADSLENENKQLCREIELLKKENYSLRNTLFFLIAAILKYSKVFKLTTK